MKPMRLVNAAVASLALMGVMCQPVLAAGPQTPIQTKKVAQTPAIEDVALNADNSLNGRVVDEQGKPMDGAAVVVYQGKEEVARTVANKSGEFTVQNLKGGVHVIAAGQSNGVYRLWTAKAAPKTAQEGVLMVAGQSAIRGQFGGVDPTLVLLTGGVVAAVVISSISLSQINQTKNEVDKIPKSN